MSAKIYKADKNDYSLQFTISAIRNSPALDSNQYF